jgi:uncharacterized phiE125 gp8 family phage protein
MVWRVITEPTAEPVSVLEAKEWMRIVASYTADDALIGLMITAARQYIERACNRALSKQKWLFTFDCFPDFEIYLAGTIRSVDKIEYLDFDGLYQELTSFSVRLAEPVRVSPAPNEYWPLSPYANEAVKITASVGYDVVPESLKTALKGLVTHWYETRQAGTSLQFYEVPMFVEMLLSQYTDKRIMP